MRDTGQITGKRRRSFGREEEEISEDLAWMAKEGTAASSNATNFEGHWNARMLLISYIHQSELINNYTIEIS